MHSTKTPAGDVFESVWLPLIQRQPQLKILESALRETYKMLFTCLAQGGKILVCGNGGSASDSSHFVGELMKGFESNRPVPPPFRERMEAEFGSVGQGIATKLQGALPAIALTDCSALISAILNDTAADMIFAQQVYGLARPPDVVMGISTSGNSANVVNALIVAKVVGAKTLALVGPKGGKMAEIADGAIRAPGEDVPSVQENHLPIYHALASMLERHFF